MDGSQITLSLAGYSFRRHLRGRDGQPPQMTLEDLIDFTAAQGIEGVELTSYFFPRTDEAYLASLKRRAFLNGLTITGTPVGNDFCLPPGPDRDGQIAHVKKWVDHAALLGAPCIRIFAGKAGSGQTEEEARKLCIEGLKEACAYAGTRGIVLALENHGGITATAKQLLKLVHGTDSPWLGINLDTGNFRSHAYEEMEKVASHSVVVQHKVELRDATGKQVPSDFGRVLKILRNSGYRGVVALEYEAREDPMAAVPRYLDEMKRALEA